MSVSEHDPHATSVSIWGRDVDPLCHWVVVQPVPLSCSHNIYAVRALNYVCLLQHHDNTSLISNFNKDNCCWPRHTFAHTRLFAQYLNRDDNSPAPGTMIPHQTPPASMSSTSSQYGFTPPFTATTSAVGRSSTPSSGSEDHSEADQVSPNLGRTTSATPRFMPSLTSSYKNQNQGDFDPDIPLPSVERDISSTTDHRSTPVQYTPSLSSDSHSTEPARGHDSIVEELCNIQDLRLTSPDTESIPQRALRTSSIHVTPSAPRSDTRRSRSSRDDSIIAGVEALQIEAHRANSLGAGGLREGSSPSPSRRRRSGSGIRRERHLVEDEDPPAAFANMAEVQEALADARTLTRRIANVLSSSSLHHENGSSIQNLHQQATRLESFQLPSSRIVGLVGDSGVGKSSLINSLLDKSGLARAVSNLCRPSSILLLTQIKIEQQWHSLYVCGHGIPLSREG
jgi:hypothetical protein